MFSADCSQAWNGLCAGKKQCKSLRYKPYLQIQSCSRSVSPPSNLEPWPLYPSPVNWKFLNLGIVIIPTPWGNSIFWAPLSNLVLVVIMSKVSNHQFFELCYFLSSIHQIVMILLTFMCYKWTIVGHKSSTKVMGECARFWQILKRIPLEAAQEHMKESNYIMGKIQKLVNAGIVHFNYTNLQSYNLASQSVQCLLPLHSR